MNTTTSESVTDTSLTDAQMDAIVTFARMVSTGKDGAAQHKREQSALRSVVEAFGRTITKQQAEALVGRWW